MQGDQIERVVWWSSYSINKTHLPIIDSIDFARHHGDHFFGEFDFFVEAFSKLLWDFFVHVVDYSFIELPWLF